MLPMLCFAYNTAVHSMTKTTPFEMVYGRQPKIPIDVMCESKRLELQLSPGDYAEHISKVLHSVYEKVRTNIDTKMDYAKIRHDRKVRAPYFEINDLFWVYDVGKVTKKGHKFIKNWKGPYRTIAKVNDTGYTVKPVNKNGRSKFINQKNMKNCFGQRYVASGCNDIQILIPVGRPRKRVANRLQLLDDNEFDVVETDNKEQELDSTQLKTSSIKAIEQAEPNVPLNVEITVNDNENCEHTRLRRSSRIKKQPDQYINLVKKK
jgi:hypothetical protein